MPRATDGRISACDGRADAALRALRRRYGQTLGRDFDRCLVSLPSLPSFLAWTEEQRWLEPSRPRGHDPVSWRATLRQRHEANIRLIAGPWKRKHS